jgi:diaminohydroxyphosphoribosylaminopyrimidine deaminase/5-amino-6-(5-phosphoribosylamino)uracil reductase
MKTEQEEKYMHRCLQLAAIGGSFVAPNPMVGAIVVHQDKIIGEGYHVRYGALHAEPKAIYAVKEKELLKESTLYVNLEPCSHFGKTPPCANLIVETGIPRVVIGTLDPNPKVSGRGVKILEKAGIEVKVGVLEDACNALNKRFFHWQKYHRPYIYLKWAQTKDGFMDALRTNPEILPLQISNPITRQLTHKFRSENQAIMVSTNTVILDNPSLTVRNWTGKNPVRIALDRIGRIPENYNMMDNSVKTLIFTENKASHKGNTEFIQINFEEDTLNQVMKHLADRNIHSVLVEGGAKLLHSFIRENLWDEINIEVSETIIEKGVAAPVITGIPHGIKEFDNHQWISYINKQNHEK